MAKKQLGSYIIESAKIRLGWGFNLFKMLKMFGWDIILLKMQK